MSVLTDNLLDALETLLRSGAEIPASDLRAFQALVIGAIAQLEGRLRGSEIFANELFGQPPVASLGLENDIFIGLDSRDLWRFVDGEWILAFNFMPPASTFVPVPANQYDAHPAFGTEREWLIWLTQNRGTGGGTTPTPTPTISSFSPSSGPVGTLVTVVGTNLSGATLSFHGTAAVASNNTATGLSFTVPAGGTTGTFAITTANGSVTSSTSFTVTVPGTVPGQVGTVTPAPAANSMGLSFPLIAGATSYTAKYRATGIGSYVTGATGSGSPLTITGLTSVPYDFTVTASNSVGAGQPSAVVTATPRAVRPTYVMTGQSNLMSIGQIAPLLSIPAFVNLSPNPLRTYTRANILYLGNDPANSVGVMQLLQPPTAVSGPGAIGNNMAGGDGAYTIGAPSGPAIGQETVLSYLHNRQNPSKTLDVFKRSADGQPISVWIGPDGILAKQGADWDNGLTLLPANTDREVELFIFNQGESDNGRTVTAYQADLVTVLNGYRTKGMIQPNTKIVLVGSKVGGSTDTAKQNVAAADTSGKTIFINTTDLPTNDGVHYTGPAQLTLGERIFNAVYGTNVTILPTGTYLGLVVTGPTLFEEDDLLWQARAGWIRQALSGASGGFNDYTENPGTGRYFDFRLTDAGYIQAVLNRNPAFASMLYQVTGQTDRLIPINTATDAVAGVVSTWQLPAGDYRIVCIATGGPGCVDAFKLGIGTAPA